MYRIKQVGDWYYPQRSILGVFWVAVEMTWFNAAGDYCRCTRTTSKSKAMKGIVEHKEFRELRKAEKAKPKVKKIHEVSLDD